MLLHKQGNTPIQIGRRLEMSQSTVRQIVERNGEKPNVLKTAKQIAIEQFEGGNQDVKSIAKGLCVKEITVLGYRSKWRKQKK